MRYKYAALTAYHQCMYWLNTQSLRKKGPPKKKGPKKKPPPPLPSPLVLAFQAQPLRRLTRGGGEAAQEAHISISEWRGRTEEGGSNQLRALTGIQARTVAAKVECPFSYI